MIGAALVTVVALFAPLNAWGFSLRIPLQTQASTQFAWKQRRWELAASGGGKGFGSASEPAPRKKSTKGKSSPPAPSSEVAPVSSSSASKPQPSQQESAEPMNAGQRALAELRRQKAEQKDAELRKMRDMMQADSQLQDTPAAIPEKVAQRMGTRMLGFVGVPLFLGMAAFVAFWYFATYKDVEFQPGMVATTTIVILAVSLMGITYSVMSTSWDEEREGNILGVDEFQRNVGNIQEGLERSKENVLLREKMSQSSSAELSNAMADLERRETKKASSSLESKLKDELE